MRKSKNKNEGIHIERVSRRENELLFLMKDSILENRYYQGKRKYFSCSSVREFGELTKSNKGNETERANWINSPSKSPDREYC